ncbi:XdhC/CoxI family protein [Arcobacteraceae bacterium]|nr:XdhC/CoxI family protein [Arcobacteraceae bacterium]
MFVNKEYLNFINKSKKHTLDIVGISVVDTLGSTYAKNGNMLLINSSFEYVGVLGSPWLQEKMFHLAQKALATKETILFENIPKEKNSGHGVSKYLIQAFFYTDNYGALGSAMENYGKTLVRSTINDTFEIVNSKYSTKLEDNKFYQTIQTPYSLLIFGSGDHVSSLISMANFMGWRTTVIDLKIIEHTVIEADEVIHLEELKDILSIDLSSYNASVILSHSSKTDDKYLESLVKSNVEYIGILGNKRNMKKKIKQFSLEEDKRVFTPVGLDIGGIYHQSIALSICSQIEARKNGKI